jgi:MEMO1 family protein
MPAKTRKRMLPAGWYPYDGRRCREEIESFLEGWAAPESFKAEARGGIVPHAGWTFSGKAAARVFSCLKSGQAVDVVVVYGGHMGVQGHPRIVLEERWDTPLGEIEVDVDFAKRVMDRVDAQRESASTSDNTIEVQLPMIKYFFPEARLLAIRSPLSPEAESVGRAVAEIARSEKISIAAVGSTDLTHYGPNYGFLIKGTGPASVDWVKNENDEGFIRRALEMDEEGLLSYALQNESACSAGAAVSAISTCKLLGAKEGTLIEYYTSYDILPDQSFVGYAGIVY